MEILVLTQIVPYPPDAGPKVKTWHVLRYLAERGHRVTLVTFVRQPEREFLPQLEQVCARVHAVPLGRSRAKDLFYLLSSQAAGRSFLIERDNLPAMRRLVADLMRTQSFDYALADQLTMTQFLTGLTGPKLPVRIFDAHNAVYTIVDRMLKEAAPAYLRPVLRSEAQRVKTYEGRIVGEFEHTLAVTEIDRNHLAAAAVQAAGDGHSAGGSAARQTRRLQSQATGEYSPRSLLSDMLEKISVVPIAVDTQAITPVHLQTNGDHILTLGTLHYPPNADGIRWFINAVLPLITRQVANARLTIVGKNPPPDFLQLAAARPNQVTVTGYVPELRPYLEAASLVVVPVRAGSGMRVRILEAFSAGLPVVTTTVGLEGIQASPGEDVLVADSPEAFAGAVVELLRDADRRKEIARRSRALAESRYDWRVVLHSLDGVFCPR